LQNKNVLLTGGDGFLGRYIRAKLEAKGYSVAVPEYDLTFQTCVNAVFAEVRPDIVIHAAARVGGIEANKTYPASFFYDNLSMGLEVMHEAAKFGVDKFVQIGSACIYPKDAPLPLKEEDIWNGYPEPTNAPYGIAKRVLLTQAQAYRQQYGLNAIYLIPTNLYGPGDNFNPKTSHVVPALIKKFYDAERNGDDVVEVWGVGTTTREFLYVDDCARGVVAAMEGYDKAEPVNLGSGHEIALLNLATLIAEITGYKGCIRFNADKPSGQPRRRLDTSRAFENFDFMANVGLSEGLRRTFDWYRNQ
jgi:GDP-L-fucose synthase